MKKFEPQMITDKIKELSSSAAGCVHPQLKSLLFLLLLASASTLHAAPRPWKSTDGQLSIQGEFLKRDATSITIRRPNGNDLAIPFDQLHPDDRAWVNDNHPLAIVKKPAQVAVFDQLVFGDTRDQVTAKLKASKFVELTVPETFLGRTGLNGVFRTRRKIGKLSAMLNFDWSDTGGLKEVTLQTESLPAAAYHADLEQCWTAFISLLETLYGKPVQNGSMPAIGSLAEGAFFPSHLWAIEGVGSALLGTARDGENYQLVVRFTRKKVEPVALP
jgi:hypothetical protein